MERTQQIYRTKDPDVVLRFALEEDVPTLLRLIRGLAEYEKMENDVAATEETLRDSLFRQKSAEAVLAELRGEPVGYALFFHNFSTFLGRSGLYLEDIFVEPGCRRRGIGGALLSFLARLAVGRGCGRMEWTCLNWNKPSADFYRAMGAKPQEQWTIFRLDGEALPELAEKF